MITNKDIEYLKIAIENSKKSFEAGNFPAGAIVVKDGKILSTAVSSPYPGLFHADSKAVIEAFNKIGPLKGATLYIGLESCLMCAGVAYWSGLRRIVYAAPKSNVSGDYYETPRDTSELITSFNEPIEFLHVPECEEEALRNIREWEEKYLKKI
ncbi:MAG TPA: deaminase [Patescibacteria group bacterium]|nr:deaminase [Patescibacteria group bacterium]